MSLFSRFRFPFILLGGGECGEKNQGFWFLWFYLILEGLGPFSLREVAPAGTFCFSSSSIRCTYAGKLAKFLVWKTRVRILGFYFTTIGENLQFWSEWPLLDKTIFSRTRQKNYDKNVPVTYQSWQQFCNIYIIIATFKDWIWPLFLPN